MSYKLPVLQERSEGIFKDYKSVFDKSQALSEANRCLYCVDAPCIKACPTEIDIPDFIRKISTDNMYGSAKTIFESNILGMSCARVCPVEVLCVGSCVYNHQEAPPIQIGKLQRYATDMAFEKGWNFFEAGKSTGHSVGILGAGPAGLAAAHQLRQQGHAVTIYEKREVLGGLNTFGVAPYKMKADRSIDEVEWLMKIGGIEVKTGVSVPDQMSWTNLFKAHSAVLLGFGLGKDKILDIQGLDAKGHFGAVEYIEQFKLGKVSLEGVRNVIVLGGGNTAIDVVRELKALLVASKNKAANVFMAYRGAEESMSGYAHEWSAAKEESVRGIWAVQPLSFTAANGKITHVRFAQLNDKKQPIAGAEFSVEADLVLWAVGQSNLTGMLGELKDVKVEKGQVQTDAQFMTSRPGFFAAGDCRNGGKEVVNAVAEGRDAAIAIDAYLKQVKK
jgi:dihydropyrimidine dehydrogenase (NAD+) subunit PreT